MNDLKIFYPVIVFSSRLIFEKIDTDKDGIVNEEELEKWITTSQERYVREDTEREFAKFDENKDGQVKWDEYYKITFGFLKGIAWVWFHFQRYNEAIEAVG